MVSKLLDIKSLKEIDNKFHKFDNVYMNLPVLAIEFLGIFFNMLNIYE